MDISSPNNKNMLQEAVEGGGQATATMEVPSLDEIIKQPPEQAVKSLETFKEAHRHNLKGFFDLVQEKAGDLGSDFEARTVVEMRQKEQDDLMKDMYRASVETIKNDNPEVFIAIEKTRKALVVDCKEKMVNTEGLAKEEVKKTYDILEDTLYGYSLLRELEKAGDNWEPAREELVNEKYISEGETAIEVEKREVPPVTKENLPEVADAMRKGKKDYEKYIDAVKTEVIEPTPQEIKISVEQQKESTTWKLAKKGMLYLAIGAGVGAALYFGAPHLGPWIKDLILSLFGEGSLDTLGKTLNGAFSTIKEGLTFIGDRLGSAWNWMTGIFGEAEAGKKALDIGNKVLGSRSGGGLDLPDIPIFPSE
jgi:hypothetical protein